MTNNSCTPLHTGFDNRGSNEPCAGEAPVISVVMPALNEELTIGECISGILTLFVENHMKGEIIVSDSSADGTAGIARDLGATVVHTAKMGYGFAYLEGFRHVNSDVIVMMDADGTYDPSEILRLVEPLKKGADLVIGSRFKGTIDPGAMAPLHRYIGNPFLTRVLNLIFHTQFSDAHSGFRAIKRGALEKLNLKTSGMEFASEMLVLASIKGLVIEEIPIRYFPRKAPSNLHSFADGWRHLRFILLMKPVPFLAIPGLIFSLFGVILMTVFYVSGDIETSHLHSFILGSILLIGGVQVIIMGINTEVYSILNGFNEKTRLMTFFLNYHSLEKFLVIGGAFIVTGILLGATIILDWIRESFGEISQISTSVVSLSLIIIGIQVISCSIFISMMLLNNGDFT
ncbi:MAG: glycosyltransferase [Methanomicrobiales archaeon]|nr:glycosyltransferase [Methanomicrobiales archaeon]